MKIKLYLSKPGTGKKADQLRKTVLKDYESRVPLEQIIKRTNHKDTDALLRYIEKIKTQDREKTNQQTAIYANVSYNMKVAKIYTGKSILPAYWNPKTNQARNTPKFPQFPEFNEWAEGF